MICKSNSKFPYPILSNVNSGYKNCEFIFDIELMENVDIYGFKVEYNIESDFINNLINEKKAEILLIVQSKDSKYFKVKKNNDLIEIPKKRMSLSNRTTLQLLIKSKEKINFEQNDELNSFYKEFKNEISVSSSSILGFSNTIIFDDNINRPLDLFEKKVNQNIKSDIEIEIGTETIIINYKNEDLQFSSLRMSNTLNNPYVYMGLQKALYQFIINYGQDMGGVDIDEMEVPTDELSIKLYNLMKSKMVFELNYENIDEVIYMITDKIIDRYAMAIRELSTSGN